MYEAARAARLVYLDPAAQRADEDSASWPSAVHLHRGSHVLSVYVRESIRLCAFRGTDDITDWLTSATVRSASTPWGRVHRGFAEVAAAFVPDLVALDREAAPTAPALWLTGHSLGGALAILTAAYLVMNGRDVACVCTFGQPAVGDETFAARCDDYFGGRYVRCVNHRDAVVDAPLFWTHAGRLWYFDAAGGLHHEVPWHLAAREAMTAPRLHGNLARFRSHGMDEYVSVLAPPHGTA